MEDFYGFVVTRNGRELIAKLTAGKQLQLSKIMAGTGGETDFGNPAAAPTLKNHGRDRRGA